jgi:hypothetical protein
MSARYDESYFDESFFDEDEPPAPPSPQRKSRMSTLPVTDAIGFAQRTKEMLVNYQADMVAKGSDPAARLTRLDAQTNTLNVEDQKQEALKTSLAQQTVIVTTAKDALVREASSGCDLVIATFGRNSAQAKEATRLRNSVSTTARRAAKTPAPTP